MIEKNIIGIHTPKTGGASLKEQITLQFNKKDVYFDYDDDPADPRSISHIDPEFYSINRFEERENYRFIYGHFPSWKYRDIKNAFRMTFLRHPIDNVFSIYNFWMSHDIGFWDSPIFKHIKENNLTIIQFSALPIIRYLYSKTYFRQSDLEKFDFIGEFSNYDQELDRLGSMIGVAFRKDVCVNTTLEKASLYGHKVVKSSDISPMEFSLIEDMLADDIRLYERFSGQ